MIQLREIFFLDNKNIKELNLYNLRGSIGIVPQDAFFFSDTIKNNIKFGKENATDEEVINAAKMRLYMIISLLFPISMKHL
jgi:ATP-binding cassette subfamily B protein